jgi:signal transduction histidine kinase
MLERAQHLFALLSVALSMIPSVFAFAGTPHTAVVLYSDDRLLPADIAADRGLRAVIADDGGGRVELFDEFLDQAHFGGSPGYEQTILNYLHEKYASRAPDILIAGGNEALGFVLRNRARLFPEAPVVHWGVDRSYLQSIPNRPTDLIGIPVEYDIAGTIDQALRWHPSARNLVLVTGAGPSDREFEAALRREAARLDGRITTVFLAGLPSAILMHRLGALGPDTVVVTPGYYEDGTGRIFIPHDSVELMAAASTAPIYTLFDTSIGTGVVGGRMPSFESMGRQAGEIVIALLAGTSPASLNLPEIAATQLHVDWRQIRRWGIDEANIPKDTIFHFRPPSLWDAYREETIAGGAAILLLSGLSIRLLTERRSLARTSAALRASEQRMTLAARAAKLAMWIWNVADDRISVVPHFQSAGQPPIKFADVLAAVHPADRDEMSQAVQKALAANHELNLEYRAISQEGQERWIAVRGRQDPVNNHQWLGIVLDVTDRKQAQIHAEQDRTALQHLARVSMLGQMSASIAHQLNQPLAAILANAEAAQQVLREEPIDLLEMKDICNDIVAQDQRAADVVRRLRALFKRQELEIQRVDLHALLTETIELVYTNLMADRITLVTQFSAELYLIDGDRVQLQQVFLNLIMNATEAMGSVPIVMRQLMLHTESTAKEVRLHVKDRGPGIAPENLEKVFEPFWSAKPSGMGIGLSICRLIVAAHRGMLTVANNPDGGVTFSIVFPTRLPA